MGLININTPLQEISGIRGVYLDRLQKLGLQTAGDLLRHFPTRYENFAEVVPIAELSDGTQATVSARVERLAMRRAWSKRTLTIVEATLNDGTGKIKAVWFNQPYLKNILPEGSFANFSGKVGLQGEILVLQNPIYERILESQNGEFTHTAGLIPIYPETKGITSRYLRILIKEVLEKCALPEEWLPEIVSKKMNLPEVKKAYRDIHFPETEEDAEEARRRFSFEDLFLLQYANYLSKEGATKENAPVIKSKTLEKYTAALPFKLTDDQQKCVRVISEDLLRGFPMNRLLQGDVGSGKTIVAMLATLSVAEEGSQVAFMAPTEILVRQHFETYIKLSEYLEKNKIKTYPAAVLTSSGGEIFYEPQIRKNVPKSKFKDLTESSEIKIYFGTQSLIQKNISFKNLGLVIIDEQHRFGVRQRQTLAREKAQNETPSSLHKNKLTPHLLSMTATPIPRTLALTVFGDLDVSVIAELPRGRKPIITKIVSPENRIKAYGFIKGEVMKGRQTFIICPRIERNPDIDYKEMLGIDAKTVKEEYEKLKSKIFPEFSIAMLHGKMKAEEKEEIMAEFKNNKTQILVSTSVVEVGVDIPNASVMVIEGAERFGLAQLHQFRGRVGRGEHQSYCLLFTESEDKLNNSRLKAVERAKNGIDLAEEDLRLRGPGEFLGDKQSGAGDSLMRGLTNPRLVEEAQEAVKEILMHKLVEYPALKEKALQYLVNLHRD